MAVTVLTNLDVFRCRSGRRREGEGLAPLRRPETIGPESTLLLQWLGQPGRSMYFLRDVRCLFRLFCISPISCQTFEEEPGRLYVVISIFTSSRRMLKSNWSRNGARKAEAQGVHKPAKRH